MPSRQGRSDQPGATSMEGVPSGAAVVAGRYILLRDLGAGGMGSVYLARDRQTGESVALKQLTRADAKSVLRFKREFRSVSHVQHPNLVRLYDLECESNGVWFLTMEYVPGVDLVSSLRPDDAPAEISRVIDTFRQVARGVHALHNAGMLHRDLKPSNVLVAADRVLVLDFGLVRGIDEHDARVTEEGMVSGTPAYMAPEQARAQPLTAAADWYALGVMLYEVLSGELPFDGAPIDIMRQKIDRDPPLLEQLEPDVPRPLAELCRALLSREPAERPTAAEIFSRLGASRPAPPRPPEIDTTSLTDVHTGAVHFVGRSDTLLQLRAALADVERGQTVAVHVRGLSGAGKSALIERFLGDVESGGAALGGSDVLVLRSRCYEREAMPFKALDSIMDALVLDLARRDDVAVGYLLPTDIQALAQLFPVLERVHAVKKLLGMQRIQSHARSLRQRAEAALRELFARLSRARTLVLWVDDLHWGDLDSVAILRAWLEQDEDAPFLLLLSYRSDEADTSPALRALLAPSDPSAKRVSERRIEIGPLTRADMRVLCSERLGTRAFGRNDLIERIIDEADGNPFLASQLAALALAKIERGESDLRALSIDALVTQTQAMLPPEATGVLAVLAVAGRPMAPKLALRVADVRHGGRAVLHELRNLNLVRTRDADGDRLIEIYHDRIREHVYARLSPAVLRAIHSGLLRALEHSGRGDPDWLHSLALGAGDHALALQYGLNAAERAHGTLAFERAAELYTRCLELAGEDAAQRYELWRKLGLVLGYSGRGGRAAEALLEAAQLCSNPVEALHLKRMAAAHFVRSGRFEDGDRLFEEVMAAAGIRAPRSDGGLMAAIVWERTLLGLRGLSFRQRSAEEISPATLSRIDLLEDLRVATNNHDALRSVLFATQSLRLALDAGEPRRIVRALGTVATLAAGDGTRRGSAAARDMLERAAKIGQELGSVTDRIGFNVSRAAVCFYELRYAEVIEAADEVEQALRDQREYPADSSDGIYFFRFAANALRLGALYMRDWTRFAREFQSALREAHATENVHAVLQLAVNEILYDELVGRTEFSVSRLKAQRSLLPRQKFTVLHVLHMSAVAYAACATATHDWGIDCLATDWPAFQRSPLRANPGLAMMAHLGRARLHLSLYAYSGGRAGVLADALESALALHEMNAPQGEALRARIAYFQGDRAGAFEWLAKGATEDSRRGTVPIALRERCALELLRGGDEGKRAAAEALNELEQKFGCHDATAMMRNYFPELAGSL